MPGRLLSLSVLILSIKVDLAKKNEKKKKEKAKFSRPKVTKQSTHTKNYTQTKRGWRQERGRKKNRVKGGKGGKELAEHWDADARSEIIGGYRGTVLAPMKGEGG